MINTLIQRIYTVNIFTITNFFDCDVSNVVNINPFVTLFCQFLARMTRTYFEIDNVDVKVICSIFKLNLFDFSHP